MIAQVIRSITNHKDCLSVDQPFSATLLLDILF